MTEQDFNSQAWSVQSSESFHCHRLRIKRKGKGVAMKGFVVCDLAWCEKDYLFMRTLKSLGGLFLANTLIRGNSL